MTLTNTIIGICWFIVVIIWLRSGIEAKKAKKDTSGKTGRLLRLFLIAGFLLCFIIDDTRRLNRLHLFSPGNFAQWTGVALCIIGVSFAIWARLHIGRNWAMPMALKEQTQLVTTGPYRLVRHPIYSGLSLAMLGSIITASVLWVIWYSLWIIYFLYSAIKEEKTMDISFPNEYAAYKKRTTMFIPFVL